MHPIDIENCLSTMTLLVDTRERLTEEAQRRYESFGLPYLRQHLDFGDYTYNFILPDDSLAYMIGPSIAVKPDVVIERKMSLEELSACFCQERDRFEREMQRAHDHGCKMYLLVENASFEKLIAGHYRTKFNPNAFLGSLLAWQARYDLSIIFCKKETSGRLIKEILYRELKERLEKGDYG